MRHSIRLLVATCLGGALLAASLALLWAGSMGAPLALAAATCNAPGESYLSIQGAINDPNCTTIVVASDHHEENLVINRTLTLRGESKTGSIIDGRGNGPVIRVTGGAPTIENLTITGGDASNALGCGGGVSIVGTGATVRDNIIVGNVASSDEDVWGWGGGVCAMTGTATVSIYNNTIQDNTAFSATAATMVDPGRGGGIGIWRRHSTVVITGNQVINNVAARLLASNAVWAGGGGILCDADGTTIVEGNTIQGNVANNATGNSSGGGVCLHYGTMTFNNNYVLDNLGVQTEANTAWGGWASGGGVVIYGAPTATVRGNWVMTNAVAKTAPASASQDLWAGGGGISVQDPDNVEHDSVLLQDNHIVNNTVVHTFTTSGVNSHGNVEGGGLRVEAVSTTLVLSNEVRGNMAVRYMSLDGGGGGDSWGGRPTGGGMDLVNLGSITLRGNQVLNNTTAWRQVAKQIDTGSEGGGITIRNVADATLVGNTVRGNAAVRHQSASSDLSENHNIAGMAGGVSVQDTQVFSMTANEVRDNVSVWNQVLTNVEGGNRSGGLWLQNIASGSLQNNTISDNCVVDKGTIHSSRSDPLQAYGGGIVGRGDNDLTFVGNQILDNLSARDVSGTGSDFRFDILGGGVSLEMDGPVVLRSNIISGNTTTDVATWSQGGGVELCCGAHVDMARNLVVGNRAWVGSGGGLRAFGDDSSLSSTNDIVARNSDGISISDGIPVTLVNDTFYDNGPTGVSGSGTVAVVVTNTIVSHHDVGFDFGGAPPGCLVEDYNLLFNTSEDRRGPITPGAHSFTDEDPRLVNAAADDFRLANDSPAIDKASAAWAPADDFYGVTRPVGAVPDIGAAEYMPGLYLPLVTK